MSAPRDAGGRPPFLDADRLARFNARAEIVGFGLAGHWDDDGTASIRFARLDPRMLGGGGEEAVNGGMIAAGFDAACVLAALAQYPDDTIVTLTLQVQYLRLARPASGLAFRAWTVKRGRGVCFVHASLAETDRAGAAPVATAQATLAPVAADPTPGGPRA